MLAALSRAGPPSREGTRNREPIRVELAASEHAPGQARSALEPLKERISADDYVDLRLMASELVSDCIRDGGGTLERAIALQATIQGNTLRLEVADPASQFEVPDSPPDPGETGFGLYLVSRLADRWGVERGRGEAAVWLERQLH